MQFYAIILIYEFLNGKKQLWHLTLYYMLHLIYNIGCNAFYFELSELRKSEKTIYSVK